MMVMVMVLASLGAFAQQGRLDPAEARALEESGADPLAVADAYNDAWEHEEALRVLGDDGEADAHILWRRARSNINIGENLGEEESEPYFEKAYEQATRAVELAPDDPDARLTLAVAAGRMALLRGPFSAAGLVKEAHRNALEAVAQADSLPVALYVLGRTHKKLMEKSGFARTLAGLTFADEDSISYYFDRALEVSAGNMIQCRVEYADHLLNGDDEDPEKAKAMLEAALALPLRDEQDEKARQRGEQMLAELE